MAENGSHEANVYNAVTKDGLLQADLQVGIVLLCINLYINAVVKEYFINMIVLMTYLLF